MAQKKKPAAKKKRTAAKKAPLRSARASELASEPQPTESALFVFQGTVLELAGATFAEVPAGEDTVVVRVDEILSGPEILRDFVNQPITVRLVKAQHVEQGNEYLFHTKGWIFGSGLAVHCIAVEAAHPASVAKRQAEIVSAPGRLLRDRAARASLVVSGQVSQVRDVERDPSQPISEHEPIWHDAVVRVSQTHKMPGRSAPKEVVVRFASSRDVSWARAPKFHVGNRGTWLLGDTSEPVAAARVAMSLKKDHYLVVEPEDFHPEENAPAVLASLAAKGGKS